LHEEVRTPEGCGNDRVANRGWARPSHRTIFWLGLKYAVRQMAHFEDVYEDECGAQAPLLSSSSRKPRMLTVVARDAKRFQQTWE